jgi:hypothetical protein
VGFGPWGFKSLRPHLSHDARAQAGTWPGAARALRNIRPQESFQRKSRYLCTDPDWTQEQTFSTRAPSSRGGSAKPRDSTGVCRAAVGLPLLQSLTSAISDGQGTLYRLLQIRKDTYVQPDPSQARVRGGHPRHGSSASARHPALCNRCDWCSVPGGDCCRGVSFAPSSAVRFARVHGQDWNFFSLQPQAAAGLSLTSRSSGAAGSYRQDWFRRSTWVNGSQRLEGCRRSSRARRQPRRYRRCGSHRIAWHRWSPGTAGPPGRNRCHWPGRSYGIGWRNGCSG